MHIDTFISTDCHTKGAILSHIYEGKLFHIGSIALHSIFMCVLETLQTSIITDTQIYLAKKSVAEAGPRGREADAGAQHPHLGGKSCVRH